jgi:hypothetical protein
LLWWNTRDSHARKRWPGIIWSNLLNSNMLILSYITGREWDYVMISLVRTLPSNKIEKNPDTDWIQRHVGEMSDINQINLMLTRARCGLVLIGRSTLMLTRARCGLVLIGRSTLIHIIFSWLSSILTSLNHYENNLIVKLCLKLL